MRTDQKIAMATFIAVVVIILAISFYGFMSGAWERVPL